MGERSLIRGLKKKIEFFVNYDKSSQWSKTFPDDSINSLKVLWFLALYQWTLLHICPVTFISFIAFTKVHLFIYVPTSNSFILQIIVHLIHIHHIWFYSCCIVFQPHRVFHFLNQSHLWKPGVPLDKTLIWNIIVCIRVSTPPPQKYHPLSELLKY